MLVRILLAIAFIASALPASAMTVSPVHVELSSAGSRNRSQITVINSSDSPLPVEALLVEASLDESGRVRASKAGEDFLIMPPQALIPPHSTQNFRIQWLGNPLIDSSRSYLLYFSQVPVQQARKLPSVQVVMSVGVMINVAPPRGTPSLDVESAGVAEQAGGHLRPVITVRNPTKIHAQLRETTIHLERGRWSKSLSPAHIEQLVGIGLVQPGQRRRFILPVDVPVGTGPLRVRVEISVRR
jgi:fimbrial chaperone protein